MHQPYATNIIVSGSTPRADVNGYADGRFAKGTSGHRKWRASVKNLRPRGFPATVGKTNLIAIMRP